MRDAIRALPLARRHLLSSSADALLHAAPSHLWTGHVHADAGGASGAAEDKIVCFTFATGPAQVAERARLSIPKAGVEVLALRPDQRIFAAGGWDGRVRVFHYSKAKPLTVLKVHGDALERAA